MDAALSALVERVQGARAGGQPLDIRGGGTNAARRAIRSSGSSTMCVVPSRYGVFRE